MTSNKHSSSGSRGANSAGGDAGEGKTKARIMAVAERLMAERGVQQFSIRDVSGGAGVNLAAINYHFGSKERLIAEVLARRITVLNAERMALLDKLEADAGGKPVGAEAIMEVLINVMLLGDEEKRARNMHTMKMLARFALDPDAEIAAMLRTHFLPTRERLTRMLARALPNLKREEIEWRAAQSFGLVWHYILFAEMRSKEYGKKFDMKKEQRRLVNFCVAGMRMPSDAQQKVTGQNARPDPFSRKGVRSCILTSHGSRQGGRRKKSFAS